MQDDDKRLAARAAVEEVRDGMLVGLGTGSTAAHAITAIAERVAAGLRIEAVATSEASATLARSLGVQVREFAEVARVDLTIDGVDEVDPFCRAIKGAGGAMLREKIVACASDRMIAIADGSKRVERLGGARLPVEVLPFAGGFVTAALRDRGIDPVVRMGAEEEPYLTDNRNLVLDCGGMDGGDLPALDSWLNNLPGVVGHGLFLTQIAAAYVSTKGEITRLDRPPGPYR